MSPKVTEWLDEMTRPENNKEFCDWAQSKGVCDRQMAQQETQKGYRAKDPNPSFYGYQFTGAVLEAYYSGWAQKDTQDPPYVPVSVPVQGSDLDLFD